MRKIINFFKRLLHGVAFLSVFLTFELTLITLLIIVVNLWIMARVFKMKDFLIFTSEKKDLVLQMKNDGEHMLFESFELYYPGEKK